jgi:hypothetical protein
MRTLRSKTRRSLYHARAFTAQLLNTILAYIPSDGTHTVDRVNGAKLTHSSLPLHAAASFTSLAASWRYSPETGDCVGNGTRNTGGQLWNNQSLPVIRERRLQVELCNGVVCRIADNVNSQQHTQVTRHQQIGLRVISSCNNNCFGQRM